jgi:hypothetical protein
LIFFVYFVGSLVSCVSWWSYFAVAGTPTATALGALEARRLNAITDATSASAALP